MANLFQVFCFNSNSWNLQTVRYHLFSVVFFLRGLSLLLLSWGRVPSLSTSLSHALHEHRPRQYDMIWQQFDLFSGFFLLDDWADGVSGCCWCLLGGWGCWLIGHAPDPKCKLNISPFLNNSTSIRLPHLCQGYNDHCFVTPNDGGWIIYVKVWVGGQGLGIIFFLFFVLFLCCCSLYFHGLMVHDSFCACFIIPFLLCLSLVLLIRHY